MDEITCFLLLVINLDPGASYQEEDINESFQAGRRLHKEEIYISQQLRLLSIHAIHMPEFVKTYSTI